MSVSQIFSSIHHYIIFFMATKVNRSTKSDFLHISKNHNKKTDKAKQIKLIVSQAFFLGKPMRDAAFFFFLQTTTTIS